MKISGGLVFLCLMTTGLSSTFKKHQLAQSRVSIAHERLADTIADLLSSQKITTQAFNLHLRAYKSEGVMEAWVKDADSLSYTLLRSYKITGQSGTIGPKRQQGDFQVPEGFYSVDRFNPWSSFHLSLGLDYPNPSDRILATSSRTGGDIFLHGGNNTVGCIPLGNEHIEELYLLAVECRDRSDLPITVHIFPRKMHSSGRELLRLIDRSQEVQNLWDDLEISYRHFEQNKQLPIVSFTAEGGHHFEF